MYTPPQSIIFRSISASLAGAVLLCLGGCSEASPVEGRALYDAEVYPIIESRCASTLCHGVGPRDEEDGKVVDWDLFFFQVDDEGKIVDAGSVYRKLKKLINTVEDPAFSTLLRKPLSVPRGGLPHYGRSDFYSSKDPNYQVIYDWITTEDEGGEDPEPLSPLEERFAEKVQPLLDDGTCMTSNCHGLTAGGIPYKLLPAEKGVFSLEATRHNYEASLRMASLDAYPEQSRLLRKSQSLGSTGVMHKGSNIDFYAGSPHGDIDEILDWICAEREDRGAPPCKEPDENAISAIVYLGGTIPRAHAFQLDQWAPGTDLYRAEVRSADYALGSSENITAHLHDEAVDIRDPAVSPDGKSLLFAMRTREDEGHQIYELDLKSLKAKQLTFSTGALKGGGFATDRDPTYIPGGAIWFASTRSGLLADAGQLLDSELYSINPDGELQRWTHSPHAERKPTFFNIGEEAGGEVGFSVLRDAIPAQARAHIFRFPPDWSSDYHQHFGVNSISNFYFDMREMPDGRFVTLVDDLAPEFALANVAMVDRNFGPELHDPEADGPRSSLPLYSPPRTTLHEEGQEPPRCRDPAPLPDGKVLVACVTDENSEAEVHTRLEVWTLREALDGSGSLIEDRKVLLSDAQLPLSDPEPIFFRGEQRLDAPAHRPSEDETATALLLHQGYPMIDALLSNLSPLGKRIPRKDFRYVRLIEALPQTPESRQGIDPADTLEGWPGATTTSLGQHGPARILAEVPIFEDGTFQVRLPADTPFRLQGLNEERMAVGTMHNRWFFVAPDTKLVQGIPVYRGMGGYNGACAACHGDTEGDGQATLELEEPDLTTSASLTLSRYENQNPFRPLEPFEVDADSRIEVDFNRDIVPILKTRCVSCHGSEDPDAELNLSSEETLFFNQAYENLLRLGERSTGGGDLVAQGNGSARQSYLIERLSGRELDAPGEVSRLDPHPKESPLNEEELLQFIRWIELGASYRGQK